MADGADCKCGAYGEHECGCGVDWTDGRVYDLEDKLEEAAVTIAVLRKMLKGFLNGG